MIAQSEPVRVRVLYGSQTGNSRGIAAQVSEELSKVGFDAPVAGLDQFKKVRPKQRPRRAQNAPAALPRPSHRAATRLTPLRHAPSPRRSLRPQIGLEKERYAVIICSTTGARLARAPGAFPRREAIPFTHAPHCRRPRARPLTLTYRTPRSSAPALPGNGDAPENAEAFVRFVKSKRTPAGAMEGVTYAVLGIGDTNYDQYAAARHSRARLAFHPAPPAPAPAAADRCSKPPVASAPAASALLSAGIRRFRA